MAYNYTRVKKEVYNKIQEFLNHIFQKPSLYLFVFFIIFSIDRHHRLEFEKDSKGPFFDDVYEYYSFLPDVFIKGTDAADKNLATSKRTIGMAVMYSPAFFIGQVIADPKQTKKDGYSEPYQWTFRWENIIICLLGLWFCRKGLLFFFNETISAISLICVFMGTNLFYYTYSVAGMSHTYLFFLYSVFIFFSINWIVKNKSSSLIWVFLVGGMIVLIRPSDIIIFLFPLLFNVNSFSSFSDRIKLFFHHRLFSLVSVLLFFIPIFFQLMIWKKYTGEYFHDSYYDERFFFNDPQIINFLFSFRKGWLVYTPIMAFSVIGIIISAKRLKSFFSFLVLFLCLNVYILSSWWDWAYGGSFGCRALIQSYAILIFPFSVFVSWIWEFHLSRNFLRYTIRLLFVIILFLLISLNLYQSKQYKFLIIHWNGMNKESYKYVFLRNLTKEELVHLHSMATPPNPQKMIKGERDE